MAFVEMHPRYRTRLEAVGLSTAAQFLALPGVIIGGHPDRHILELQLHLGGETVRAFLKREHCVRWRERIGSALRGMGFVSQSSRESRVLQELQTAGIGCPEPIAAGEDDQGRAFLLLRALPPTRELRTILQDPHTTSTKRRQLARALGRTLAQVHDSGFDHLDLCSKHVHVGADGTIYLLDWQRCRRGRVTWQRRARGLAMLHATAADHLANDSDRLYCLAAYLRACRSQRIRANGRDMIRRIETRVRQLRCRGRIRDMRRPLASEASQRLLWLDGEAMCVTADFYNEVGNVLPTWLTSAPTGCHTRAYYSRFHLSNGPVDLIRRWTNRPLYWLWHTLRRWPVRTPELRQAGTAFHLQRHDIPTPRLLAFGQRFLRPWRAESFLLTEPMVGCRDLVAWLLNHRDSPGRRQVLHAAGRLVYRLHQAGHVITGSTLDLQSPFAVQTHADQRLAVVLHDLSGVERRRKAGPRRRRADLLALARALARTGCNSADALRLFLAYHDATWLTVALRPSFRHLLTMFRRVTTRARYEATRWTVLTADPLEHRSTAAGVERTAA